ncbi:MAG: helix-turn-helix domain-containing protein [Gemmatimonadales bacterium]
MPMTETLDRLLTADEAARFLGLKVATIRRMTWAKELPVVRVTNRRATRYRLRDLEALVRMRSQPMRPVRGGEADRG